MKQNRGDWTDAVRRSLSDAEPQLPLGGWERLQHELQKVEPAMSEVRSYRSWLRFAAAAAAVLVCVSVGLRVSLRDRNVLKGVVMVPEAAVSEQNADVRGGEFIASSDITALREPVESRVPVVRPPLREVVVKTVHNAQPHVRLSQKSESVATLESQGLAKQSEYIATGAESSSKGASVSVVMQGVAVESFAMTEVQESEYIATLEGVSKNSAMLEGEISAAQSEYIATLEGVSKNSAMLEGEISAAQAKITYNTVDYDGLFASMESASSERRGGSLAFDAGGVVTSADGGSGLGPASLLMLTDGAASLRDAYEEYTYKHRQPLSLGVTVRKELKYGLSVESGLTYTLLRSDVTVPGGARDVSQKLHFIGIPLRLNWEFMRRGGFSLYVGAGGAAEKCVAARFGGEAIVEKGVQWSVFGAVGAQYRLGKIVAIYFEPEVSHHLTKTTLRTSYTDSSVNLNLQLGVRFNY